MLSVGMPLEVVPERAHWSFLGTCGERQSAEVEQPEQRFRGMKILLCIQKILIAATMCQASFWGQADTILALMKFLF